MASDPELLMGLFRGSDLTFGRSDMTSQVSSKGKHETKSWLEKRPVEIKDWEKHLAGTCGIGIPPINSKSEVCWGAIDIDIYEGMSMESLNQKVQEFKLPLVICRSKSGGPHVFLFCQDWVPAKLMIAKLDAIAGFLGFGTSEIFPKQAQISTDGKIPDYGSWINMPYFGGTKYLRYGMDLRGDALATIPAFVEYCRARSLTPDQLKTFDTPQLDTETFPDGPPCLNTLMANKPTDFRNIILSNAAVYLKKIHGEAWAPYLDAINRKFPQPLDSGEVESIKKSYEKKEYRYQCSKQPLCNFCESMKCKQKKYGIGTSDFLPTARSLTMVETTPRIWYLDIPIKDGKDGEERRISLSTEQLQNPLLFQRRVMETIRQMPPVMSAKDWREAIQPLMTASSVLHVEEEMTPEGQFIEQVYDFLDTRCSVESLEDVLRGKPYKDTDFFYFRLRDLREHLTRQKFNLLGQHDQIAILKGTLKAERKLRHIAKKSVNLILVPVRNETPEPLKPVEFKAPF